MNRYTGKVCTQHYANVVSEDLGACEQVLCIENRVNSEPGLSKI